MKKNITIFLLLFFTLGCITYAFQSSSNYKGVDLSYFKAIPVQHEGRIKPLDSVARSSLLSIKENQSVSREGQHLSPIEWLALLTMNTKECSYYPCFRIDHPNIISLIKGNSNKKYFSFKELEPYIETINTEAKKISEIEDKEQDSYQKALLQIWEKAILFSRLSHSIFVAGADDPAKEIDFFEEGVKTLSPLLKKEHLLPNNFSENSFEKALSNLTQNDKTLLEWFVKRYQFIDSSAPFQILYPIESVKKIDPKGQINQDHTGNTNNEWISIGEGLLQHLFESKKHPSTTPLIKMIHAFREKDNTLFKTSVEKHLDLLYQNESPTILEPPITQKSSLESLKLLKYKIQLELFFNAFQPFYLSILLYLTSSLLFMLSCIKWKKNVKFLSYQFLALAFTLHSIGIISRMIIEGRPPVTNLYSSALFVGWGSVLLGCIIEYLFKNGIISSICSIIGALTLIIAHHLSISGGGDTIEAMRAVLNSNFWLSTHVVTITLGYASSFLAGFIAYAYTIRKLFPKPIEKNTTKSIFQIVYGIICFSTLFSFVGTILGGIWADQSWGRFWGWDPKENGALMIVLWNAIILHARWGRVFKKDTILLLVIFGNVITSFSWFGVNMLGVGLHSYGFIESAFFWLINFMLSQIIVIVISLLKTIKFRKIKGTH